MSEREAYGMPKHKIIAGRSYEYTEPTSGKADAQSWLVERSGMESKNRPSEISWI